MGKEGEGKSEWASWCGWGSRPGLLGFKRNMAEWARKRRGRERERNFSFSFSKSVFQIHFQKIFESF
jgi:hypothetical protein